MVRRFGFDSYVQFGGSPMAAAAFATLIGLALAAIVI